ncbi:Hypothetical protein TART1_2394 [Trichococcus shcherbakoviae]|uniref:Uncharacterized protein n=1 Tax=Trichococcus shcherbakoviae TaxID=2094020 RepID=A0A383TIR3_9LACT|nr:Hypothetical protein TART1_2394 [Trichococcus shcherbakoviae]
MMTSPKYSTTLIWTTKNNILQRIKPGCLLVSRQWKATGFFSDLALLLIDNSVVEIAFFFGL